MSIFHDEAGLRRSITAAGLDMLADRIVATAKPAIRFYRRQRHDDGLAPGTSKIGGLPDLPEGFVWPTRPAHPDADAWADSIRRRRDRLDAFMAGMQARQEADGSDATALALDAEREAKRDRHQALLIESYYKPLPLAFRAQIDLGALSGKPGFDADLPKRGLLSIFEDLTGDGSGDDTRAFWHDVPVDRLRPRSVPNGLVALSDINADAYAEPWETLEMAEVLEPHPAVTIPHHWTGAVPAQRGELQDLIQDPAHGFEMPAEEAREGDNGGDFGDQLGGWPNPIQRDPELDFLGLQAISMPLDDDRVRQIFSWAGEYYGGTRLLFSNNGGDGTTHVLIDRQALLARDFSGARGVYQSD